MGTFFSEKLNWQAYGYFAQPTAPDDPALASDPNARNWLRLEALLRNLKAGRFESALDVLHLIPEAKSDEELQGICTLVLGDAGTTVCFQRILQIAEDSMDPDLVFRFCNALRTWGRLAAVPFILHQYDRWHGFQAAAKAPIYLSSLLENQWGPVCRQIQSEELDAYYALVIMHYEEMKQAFGNDQVLVFHGEQFGVVPMSKMFLGRLSDSYFDRVFQPYFRRRFEASTGINCSAFYAEGGFQPLAASAIVEEFLESPEAAKYQDGARYFFGHRIPD